jgi:putative RecB family exonuclease|tara:strand:+ start:4661 stop:5440 length:780 start_codon:yes stop_codon:yes gene_type:complete
MVFINTISNSKRDTFQQCKLKYRYRYVDRLKDYDISNTDALHFGSYIHQIFEDGVKSTKYDQLQAIAEEIKGKYTFAKSYNPKIETCLKNFLRFNASLPEMGITEQHFDIEVAEGISMNGYIDRIVKGKEGGYLVIDYKTSKREKSKVDLYQDPQLKGYVYAVHKLYGVPVDKITAAHYYPITDTLVSVKYTNNQIHSHVRGVIDDVWKIRKAKKDELLPIRNQYCNWCSYKSLCPEFCTHDTINKRLDEIKAGPAKKG